MSFSDLARYWPNAIHLLPSNVFFAKLDADKIGRSRVETHVMVGNLPGSQQTQNYTILKKGDNFIATINGQPATFESLRQNLVEVIGDVLCPDFNYIVVSVPTDFDGDPPDNLEEMTEEEALAWGESVGYVLVKGEGISGEKIKFFLRDAKSVSTPDDLRKLSNKKWCSSGGGGGMFFLGIAIAAIIAIVLYSKLAAKKR